MENSESISKKNAMVLNVPQGFDPANREYSIVSAKTEYSPYAFRIQNANPNKHLLNNKKGYVFMDSLELMSTFTPQEWRFINRLKLKMVQLDDNYKYYTTCIVHIKPPKDNAKKLDQSVGYRRLHKKNIIKRVKRGGHYMLNPNFIIPTDYNKELEIWNSL